MQAHSEMGKTFTKAGKHGRAVREFEKAVRIQAASPALWALLAEAQAEQATALGQLSRMLESATNPPRREPGRRFKPRR